MKKELQQFLKDSNLREDDQVTLKFLADSLEKGELNEFVSRSFLFEGYPGIGKTFFVEKFVKHLGIPIIFMGAFKFEHNLRGQCVQCKTLKQVYSKLVEFKEAVVFIDDLQNALQMQNDGCGEWVLIDSERKLFLKMLEHLKRTKDRKLLFMTINDDGPLEECWLDRIESRIELSIPKEKNKKIFLQSKYPKVLSKAMMNEIAERSMGYNFRDLDELIKMSYREGNGTITKNSMKKALAYYSPSSMRGLRIVHDTGINFKDIIGNERLKQELAYLKNYLKHPGFFQKNGIERSNILIFSGPPGTGKTYMARALAGELDVPLVDIDAGMIFGRGAISGLSSVGSIARRFRNCVLFIDEFDKLVGHDILCEDGEVIGNFEAQIDGIKDKTKAIIILTMNNKFRFGSALHDRIPFFEFDYPSEEERRNFIENKVKKSGLPFLQESINAFVEQTQNKSYRQIDRIWNNIIFKIMDNEKTRVNNTKIIADENTIEECVNQVLGLVSKVNLRPSMFG